MKNIDLSLYLVASREEKSDDEFLSILKNAIKGGVSIIQLREKELQTREFYALGLKVLKLCKKYKIPLIINDRIDLVLALKADGVHLGQDDLEVKIARKILGEKKIIGQSVKKVSQIKSALGCDYLGCGAISASKTKQSSIISLENLKQIITQSNFPVVAIGGIDDKVALKLKDLDLKGIAISSFIMKAKDPFEASKTLKKLWN